MYVLKLAEGKQIPWDVVHEKKLPQTIYVGQSMRRIATDTDGILYALWATKEQAEAWAAIEGVELVRKKEAKDVVTLGEAGKGDLYVDILINGKTMERQAKKGSYKLASKIVEEWQSEFAGKAAVSLVKPTKADPKSSIEYLILGGQVKISCPDGKVPLKLMDTIRNHPQVFRMQWTTPFTTMHCPGCGMG